MNKLILALVLCLCASVASAQVVGVGAGLAGAQSGSQVGSTSAGGSAAIGNGATVQASGAAAGNRSFAGAVIVGPSVVTATGSQGFTTQGGFAASTGQAGSINGNLAGQQGAGQAAAGVGTLFLYAIP